MKSEHKYRLILTETTENSEMKSITLDFQDREDIFKILNKMKEKTDLSSNDSIKLGIGLRLLGPMLMQARKHPLFVDFFPHFRLFMMKLKKTDKLNPA